MPAWKGAAMSDLFHNIPAMIVLTGVLVALSGAGLGTFLVLRGAAMLTDAISHSIVLAIILVWLLTGETSGPWQMLGAALMGLATVGLTHALQRSGLMANDAAIGLAFPALFAAGVLLINIYARDVHIDLDSVLLGEIGFVWLHRVEVFGVDMPVAVASLGALTLVNAAFLALMWKELVLSSFDPALAAALGLAPGAVGLALLALTSATAVAAFDAVGAILFIAFVTAPAATGLLLSNRPVVILGLAVAVGVASVGLGYALAVWSDVSIAPMMALVTGGFFALAVLLAPRNGVIARALAGRDSGLRHAARGLLAHLHAHEGTPGALSENTVVALRDHLHWSDEHAAQVLVHCLDRGMITRDGPALHLTEKGRAEARSL